MNTNTQEILQEFLRFYESIKPKPRKLKSMKGKIEQI